MKFDLEVYLPNSSDNFENHIAGLGGGFSLTRTPNGGKSIRTATSETEGKLIAIAVREFLEEILLLEDIIKREKSTLRLGIYFQVDEISFLSIALPQSELKFISDFNLDIDISAYPCLPDADE